MNTKSTLSRAFVIKCPADFKDHILEKFGECFTPLSEFNEEIKQLDNSYVVYVFEDCFCLFHKNKPVIVSALVSA